MSKRQFPTAVLLSIVLIAPLLASACECGERSTAPSPGS